MVRLRAAWLVPGVKFRRWLVAVAGALVGLVALAVSAQAAAPSVTSVSPGSAINNGSVTLTFTGTDMDTATGVVLRRTGQADIAGTSFTSLSKTKASAVFNIASAAPGPWDVRITNPDGTGVCTGCFTVVASGAPGINDLTPDNAGQGAVDRVITITGSHFSRGDLVTVSGGGVAVTSTTFVSSTRLDARITVDKAAATTARTVTVTHPSGYGSGRCTECLTITTGPTATAASPASGGQGATSLPVQVTGTNFAGTPDVAFSGAGVSVTDVVRDSATTLTATVTIAPDAPVGARTVSVTNPDGGQADCANCFAVANGPKPSSASPAAAGQGATLDVKLSGSGLLGEGNFADGATVAFSGTGITINSTAFTPGLLPGMPASLAVNVTLAPGADVGARDITVSNPDGGRGVCAGCFSVTAKPAVTSLSPDAGGQTATNQIVTVTGRNFADDVTAAFSGTGITVNSLTRDSARQLTLDLSIAADAPTGARDVTVTNPDQGMATCAGCYTVNAKPTVASTSPNQLGRGADKAPVVITGTGFSGVPTVAVAASGVLAGASGVTVHSVQRDSATQLTAIMSVASDAATGARSVTVTNPDGGTTTCADCLAVAVAPTVTSTAPPAVPNTGTAAIDVFGTNFTPGASVALRRAGQADISGIDTVVTSAKSLRATFDLSAVAPGPWRVRVVNPDYGTGVCADCLTVAAAAPVVTSVDPGSRSQGASNEVITVTGRNFARGAEIAISGDGITVGPTTFVDTEHVTTTISVARGAATGSRTVTVTNTDDQAGTCNCFDVSKRVIANLAPPSQLTAPVVATFSRDVGGVTTGNFVVRDRGAKTLLTPKRLVCRDVDGSRTSCAGESVRKAVLAVDAPLIPGQRYVAKLNATGGSRITDDGGGELPTTGMRFRASRFEQENSARAVASWGTVKARKAYGGSLVRDRLTGAQARFTFTGDAITWYTMTGRNQGIARVVIDGVRHRVNNYAATRTHRVARTFTGLGDGRHTIRVIATGRKGAKSATGKYVSIDAMRVEDGSVITTPRLAYRWSRTSHPDASGGRYARADQARAAMRFTFRGTRIDWHTLFSSANGKAKVFIDGQLRRTVDTYRAATRLGRYSFRGLSDRVHTIRIVVLGSRNAKSRGTTVTVDRFVVR